MWDFCPTERYRWKWPGALWPQEVSVSAPSLTQLSGRSGYGHLYFQPWEGCGEKEGRPLAREDKWAIIMLIANMNWEITVCQAYIISLMIHARISSLIKRHLPTAREQNFPQNKKKHMAHNPTLWPASSSWKVMYSFQEWRLEARGKDSFRDPYSQMSFREGTLGYRLRCLQRTDITGIWES